MSNKQPPRVQLNFEPDYEPPPHAERNRMTDIDIDIKDVDLAEHREAKEETLALSVMPKVEEKEEINEKDIFDAWRMEDKILSEQSDDDIIDPTPRPQALPQAKKQTINRVNKKPRKQMTEAHKAKLAEARKKALEVRRAKAQEKKQAKHIEQETKILKQKQKLKEFEQLKQEVEQENQQPRSAVAEREPEPHGQSPQVGVTTFTKKDLEDAQFDAILKYDALRKKQKAEKKQAEMVERQKKELLNKIAPQQYRYRDGSNPWDHCY